MVRVTFKEDGKSTEVIMCNSMGLTRGSLLDFDDKLLYTWEIVKIEKQVKDLTLEECRKLGLTETFAFEWGFGLDRGSIGNDFRDDDYIDITAIVKGQVE